ncbi:MAG: YqgE/AlgH family protein, partial [Planctomycetota bacterium]
GLWQHLSGGKRELDQGLLHFGGPESGPVVAIHTDDELAEFEPAEGVYIAAQIDTLKTLVQTQETQDCRLKIIVGQAEWKAGELQQQFMERAWLPLQASSELIFQPAATMWAYALRSFGNQMIEEVTGTSAPLDVLAN